MNFSGICKKLNIGLKKVVNTFKSWLFCKIEIINKKQYLCYRGPGQKSYEYQDESLCVYGKKVFKDQYIIKNLQTEANNKIVLMEFVMLFPIIPPKFDKEILSLEFL